MSHMPSQPIPEKSPGPPGNGLGIASLVLAVVGLAGAFIPITGFIAWPLVVVAIVCAVIGSLRSSGGAGRNRGLALSGLIVSVIGLIVCITWLGFFSRVTKVVNPNVVTHRVTHQRDGSPGRGNQPDGDKQADNQQDGPMHTVLYQASGNSSGATITYPTFANGKSSTVHDQPIKLPWSKEIQTRADVSDAYLVVLTGPSGGTVSCVVKVDNEQTKQATATGSAASAVC